jgi:hypothetical protein
MRSTEPQVAYPATSDEMTAALNAALETGDLERIMGVMGELGPTHRPGRENPLQVHAGQGQRRVQHLAPGASLRRFPIPGASCNE